MFRNTYGIESGNIARVRETYCESEQERVCAVVQYRRASNALCVFLTELYFLIAKFLSSGPCIETAQVRPINSYVARICTMY